MHVQLIEDHTLVYGNQLFKWDGETFHVYRINEHTRAFEYIDKWDKPTLVSWNDIHYVKLYMNGNLGMRIFVHSAIIR